MSDIIFRSTAIVIFCLHCLGCSFGRTRSAESIDLGNLKSLEDPTVTIEQINRSPHTYRITTNHSPLFLTALKECGYSDRVSSLGTTRSLFVGMRDLQIINQTKIELNGRDFLHSILLASYNDTNLNINTFSMREGDCVSDYVIWNNVNVTKSIDNLLAEKIIMRIISLMDS